MKLAGLVCLIPVKTGLHSSFSSELIAAINSAAHSFNAGGLISLNPVISHSGLISLVYFLKLLHYSINSKFAELAESSKFQIN